MVARRLLGVLALVTAALAVSPARAAERTHMIIGFDRTPVIWTLKARAQLLPTLGPVPVSRIVGRITCFDDDAGLCPGRRGRVEGLMHGAGDAVDLTVRLIRGTTCTFTGSFSRNEGSYTCTDRDGNVVLEEVLHVGLCRCFVRRAGVGEPCDPSPCPF